MRVRPWIYALGAVFLMGGGVLIGLLAGRLAGLLPKTSYLNTSTVIQQIQSLSELVTVKYVIEKVVVYEDAKWYGENRVILVANGVVKAGVDLGKLNATDIEIREGVIRIRLPHEQITDVYLDDRKTQVLEHSTGILRTFDKDLQQTVRQQAVDDIRRAARFNGILKDARERAELQLRQILTRTGFSKVEFMP